MLHDEGSGLTITLPELLDDWDGYGMRSQRFFHLKKMLFLLITHRSALLVQVTSLHVDKDGRKGDNNVQG
jgi:hypothetical protein